MRLPRENYGICRIDQPAKRNHGWFVRITLNRKIQSRFFADKACHGREAALQMARVYRDALASKVPKDRFEAMQRRRTDVLHSGMAGVTHVRVASTGGEMADFWMVAWKQADGRRRTARFAFQPDGPEVAMVAAKARLTAELQAMGRTPGPGRHPSSFEPSAAKKAAGKTAKKAAKKAAKAK